MECGDMPNCLEIIRRDDVSFEVKFCDIDGDAIDITGGTVYFTAKKNLYDSDDDAVISKSVNSFDDPTSGTAVITLTHSDTDIEPISYFYDVQLILNNVVTSSNRGTLFVAQDVRHGVS